MDRIKTSAPGKLMLFGEHAVIYGRPCIVSAVDQRISVFLEKTSTDTLRVNAPQVGIKGYEKKITDLGKGQDVPKEVQFVETAVRNFGREFGGLSGLAVETQSTFSSEFGFGSSSAVTVALIKGLAELAGRKLTPKKLFALSYQTVLDVQGVGSGFDLAAAIWGGTIYFLSGGKKIEPLALKRLSPVIGYSGVKADTTALVRQVASYYQANKDLAERIFEAMGLIVKKAKRALAENNIQALGVLANVNQGLLDSLGVGTSRLAALIWAAKDAGATGAKLSGAGGGDCMLAFSGKDKKEKVEAAIKKVGGKVMRVKLNAEGVRVEK